mmetsp:Transcript_18242/g.42730  ORF Transcript_18242/g.42730 Transcript_18242/m.42730 type:complete len:148 (+) Transcript_18242:802-1245(+)
MNCRLRGWPCSRLSWVKGLAWRILVSMVMPVSLTKQGAVISERPLTTWFRASSGGDMRQFQLEASWSKRSASKRRGKCSRDASTLQSGLPMSAGVQRVPSQHSNGPVLSWQLLSHGWHLRQLLKSVVKVAAEWIVNDMIRTCTCSRL